MSSNLASRFTVPIVGVCAWVQISAQQAPQTPPTTFRSSVDLVTIDVSVLDRNRKPVRGLTAADFTVLDGGVPQRIASFKAVDLPDRAAFDAPWMREIAPDVAVNRFEAERIVVLLLDDYNTAVDPAHMKSAKLIARGIIDELGPSDLGAVLYTFWHKNGQEFTSDRAPLLASVDRFVSMGRVPAPYVACPDNQCVHGAMRSAADILQRWPDRRKLLVFISPEGTYQFGPRNVEQNQTEANATGFSSVPDLQRTFQALQAANVTVYQYDPRGLKESLDVMNGGIGMYADNTGGRTFTRTNNPEAHVGEMFVENGSYYLVGIEPTRRPLSGEFRPIRVEVNRPDVSVRSRTGYYGGTTGVPDERRSGSAGAETELDKAMDGAAPTGDLPLTLTVAPFGHSGQRTATVAIVAGLDRPADDARSDVVKIAARAFDQNTTLRTSKGVATATLQLTPRTIGQDTHFDVPTTLELAAPGRYEIRLAMESTTSSLRGSAFMSITVPDFANAALSLSGVVLGRLPAARPAGRHALAGVLPFTPTTVRTFGREDRVHALVRVYQGGKRAVVPVTLSAHIVDSSSRRVYERAVTLQPGSFSAPGRTAESGVTLPLRELAPGAHLLTISARTDQATDVRHVRFLVE